MAERLDDAMAGETYDVALDRVAAARQRAPVRARRAADLGSPTRSTRAGYSNVAEGTVVALADAARREFARAHGASPAAS